VMEKKRTNSDPFMESTDKHSIYPFSRLLRVGNERRQEDTEGEGDNEPDGVEPHGRLPGSA
jgi:hypothetical protein